MNCLNSDAVQNLVGEHNMNKGAVKMFEAMQDVRLNKYLCYVSTAWTNIDFSQIVNGHS